ncbi:hypothetical protein L1887_14389 [Cichorium endivia]|nr:hypothetical protein L1887_14389 [Cichorium endivia]
MKCYMDLRYLLPPLINLGLPYVSPSKFTLQSSDLVFVSFIAIAVLLFLLVSIKLSLGVSIHINCGPLLLFRVEGFSLIMAILLSLSIFMPREKFLIAFTFVICISSFHDALLDLLLQSLTWFYHAIRSIPVVDLHCVIQQEQQQELVEIEGDLYDHDGDFVTIDIVQDDICSTS